MLKNILLVFYDRSFWTTIPSLPWRKSLFSFSLVSLLHSFVFSIILMFFILSGYKSEIDSQLSNPFPSFQIENGELTSEVPVPYQRDFEGVRFVLDPTDTTGESLKGDVIGGVLLSKHQAYIKQGENVDILPLNQITQFRFGEEQYDLLWYWLRRIGVPLYTVMVWVLELFRTLLFSIFLSFLVIMFSRFRKYPLHMKLATLVKIGVWASIPSYIFDVVILELLLSSLNLQALGFLPVVVQVVYLIQIVKQCSESEGIHAVGGEAPSEESEDGESF